MSPLLRLMIVIVEKFNYVTNNVDQCSGLREYRPHSDHKWGMRALHREFLKSEKSQVSRVGRCHKTRCWRIISWLILDSDEDAGGQLFLDFKLKNFILFDNRKISYFNLHPFFKNDGFFTVGSMRKLTILKRNSMKVEIQNSEK